MTSSEAVKRYPGETDEAFPERFDQRAMPAQPDTLKPGQLSGDKIAEFFDKGFLIIDNFFLPSELDACKNDVEKVVEDLAQVLYKAGKISDVYENAGLYERLTLIEKEYKDANVLLHKPRTKHALYQGFRDIWASPRILNLMEQILGPDVMGNPVWNLRPKVPDNEATVVPWHQDAGYTDNSHYGNLVPTAWIPLLDVKKEHGCLEVISGGHRSGKVARHVGCYKGTWYLELPEDEMEKTLGVDIEKDKVVCEVPYGGMVIFNNLLPHRGLPNVSSMVRWSMDLRWQKPSVSGGWYGTDGVMMRSHNSPVNNIDWDSFLQQNEEAKKKEESQGLDMYEPVFTSPYFDRWEMTNVNKHVTRYYQQIGRVA